MKIKQISVFIENRSGRLAQITSDLSNAGCDLLALSIADTENFGLLRVIVDDTEKAEMVLREKGVSFSVTEVVSVCIPHTPGGLAKLLTVLAEKGVAVEYLYAFIGKNGEDAQVVMKIRDADEAIKIITEAGYKA